MVVKFLILRIKYSKSSKPVEIPLKFEGFEGNKVDITEIALEASQELTRRFSKYMGNYLTPKSLEKYRISQYVMIKAKLEERYG